MTWYPVSQVPPPLLLIHLLDSRFEGFLRLPDPAGDLIIQFHQGLAVRHESPSPSFQGGDTGKALLRLFCPEITRVEMDKANIEPGNGINPLPLIREGLQECYSLERLENETRELAAACIRICPRLDSLMSHFRFTEPDTQLIDYLRKTPACITELRQKTQIPLKDILSLLYTLASCRLLEAEKKPEETCPQNPPPATSRVPEGLDPQAAGELAELQNLSKTLELSNPFARLGLPVEATPAEITARFKDLVRRFHPDTLAKKGLSGYAAEADAAFRKLTEAYNLLSDEKTREEARKPQITQAEQAEVRRVLEAEMLYQKGIIAFRRKEYDLSESLFLEAIQKNEDGSHLAMWAWVRYINPHNDRLAVREEVKQALLKAITLTPREADFYFYLGKVCLDMEQIASARQYFTRAVEIDREHLEASRELRLLEKRSRHANPLATVTGSFKNIFNKKK